MIPSDRAGHIRRIVEQLEAHGIESITLRISGVGEVPLTGTLRDDFIYLMRGNKVNTLLGSWLAGLRDCFSGVRPSKEGA